MGMDISAHIEVKVNGTWEHWSIVDIERGSQEYYFLFDIAETMERKFPEDASVVTSMIHADLYSGSMFESWLSEKELKEAEKNAGGNYCILGEDYNDYDTLQYRVSDVRIVFWVWG